jgi:hypothetical protein
MISPSAADHDQSPFQRQPVRRSAPQAIAATGHKGHFTAQF